jgi:hypothetical protein
MASATSAATTRWLDLLPGLGPALEIGLIPTAALELEARGTEHFAERFLATLGASGQRRIVHFLDIFFLETTIGTTVFVNRHHKLPAKSKENEY